MTVRDDMSISGTIQLKQITEAQLQFIKQGGENFEQMNFRILSSTPPNPVGVGDEHEPMVPDPVLDGYLKTYSIELSWGTWTTFKCLLEIINQLPDPYQNIPPNWQDAVTQSGHGGS